MAPDEEFLTLARALSLEGLPVHIEFFADERATSDLKRVARAAHPSPVDVHVMGSSVRIDEVLPAVLEIRPNRVFLPWSSFTVARAGIIRRSDARACVGVWNEWDEPMGLPESPAGPDGVLVMLSERGARERCRIRRIRVIIAIAGGHRAIPVIAAGGITEATARLCCSAGAQQIVVGKALLDNDI